MPVARGRCEKMSHKQRVVVLLVVVTAAILSLGVAARSDSPRERKQSLYMCNVWNDRSWAGCPP
jgi:hypothetical protein